MMVEREGTRQEEGRTIYQVLRVLTIKVYGQVAYREYRLYEGEAPLRIYNPVVKKGCLTYFCGVAENKRKEREYKKVLNQIRMSEDFDLKIMD